MCEEFKTGKTKVKEKNLARQCVSTELKRPTNQN